MAYLPNSNYREVITPGQTPQSGKQDGVVILRDSQYQQPYTVRNEGYYVNRESYATLSPQTLRTQAVRQDIPVAYGRSSFVENQPQYSQYVPREENLSTSRGFPQYIPGQMPADFLSVPLIPYLEGPHGPSISSFRPQLGSLPVPKAPLRFQPFPFQPSWTDALVDEMKRDPSWDMRLSFLSRLQSENQIEESRGKPHANTNMNGSLKERAQNSGQIDENRAVRRGFDSERTSTVMPAKPADPRTNRAPNPEVVSRPDSPTPTDTSGKSPPTPRVLNPKPITNQAASDEHDIKTNVKAAVSAELHSGVPPPPNAAAAVTKPVGNAAPSVPGPRAGTATAKVVGAAANGGAVGPGAGNKAPVTKPVKKDAPSGAIAARRAEYEKAAKNS